MWHVGAELPLYLRTQFPNSASFRARALEIDSVVCEGLFDVKHYFADGEAFITECLDAADTDVTQFPLGKTQFEDFMVESTSPFPGVKWRSKVRRWAADGREGTFPDELQAAAAYEEGVARQDVEEGRRAAREASRARRELEMAASPRQGDLAQLG